ncbi:MAG: hypothetical protein GY757_20700 [bacterium]|nr:hypothetical protein [bacterium]
MAPVVITGPDIKIIEYPEDLEIIAGSYIRVPLKLKNEGHLRGEALLKINAFDTVAQEREIALDPGEVIEIDEIYLDAPADLPTGTFPFNYSLIGTGVKTGLKTGNFSFNVKGISLNVEATMGQALYNTGETAQLTLNITPESGTEDAPLEAIVNWGNFSEKRHFSLNAGSTALTFDIPLDAKRDEKIFYGIYFEGGKGIHLNDIYLHFRDEISVETGKQVYEPGEVIEAVFLGDNTGTLTVSAFSENYTLPLTASASASFTVPENTTGGTYGISWNYAPADTTQPELSGSHRFDVAGLVIKVAKSELEKGKYTPGDTVNSSFTIESNSDDTLELRNWIKTPQEDWTYLGASSVAVSSANQVTTQTSYPFTTVTAGTHSLVYGLYKEDNLIVSGSMAFDAGDAVLIGIDTDRYEYKNGNENVILKATHFGEGTAQLDLFLDEEKIEASSVTLNGMGNSSITLSPDSLNGGSHSLKAVLTKDNLTSTKTTTFTYGTHLPNLMLSSADTQIDGFNYTYNLTITNTGKTASASSVISFAECLRQPSGGSPTALRGLSEGHGEAIPLPRGGPLGAPLVLRTGSDDDCAVIGTRAIQALQPGMSQEVAFEWNGTGKAGTHEFSFEVDPANAVKELSETDNTTEMTIEIEALRYNLEVEPATSWPSNSEISIITRLLNNSDTVLPLFLDLSIENETTGEVIFESYNSHELAAFGSKTMSDSFNTATFPAGAYTLRQSLSSGALDKDYFKEISAIIEVTKAIKADLEIIPVTISSDTETQVELTMDLENAGNAPIEDDVVTIEVVDGADDVVETGEIFVTLPLLGKKVEKKFLNLNLSRGDYTIRLRYNNKTIASAELSAKSAVKPAKTIDLKPRVLLMNTTMGKKRNSQLGLIANLLQYKGIEFETGYRMLDSYVKFHKGHSNIHIPGANPRGWKMRKELKERVWQGEGLILICDKPLHGKDMADFLGVDVKRVKGKGVKGKKENKDKNKATNTLPEGLAGVQEEVSPGARSNRVWQTPRAGAAGGKGGGERIIRLLPTDFSAEAEVGLLKRNRFRLVKTCDDVVVLAETKEGKHPVITYRKYGYGHILVLAVPLNVESGGEALYQLILNAVGRFSRDVYTLSDLTRILPIAITIDNETRDEKNLLIKEILPYGAEAYGYDPEPEEGDELKWKLKVPASSKGKITYWLKLPDEIDTYEIKTEIYAPGDDAKVNEVSLTFEVSETVFSRTGELIGELETVDSRGKETQYIRRAMKHLESLRNRSGESLSQVLKNLHDSIKAAHLLGQVQQADVSAQRLRVQDIMRIMGRRFYEKLKQWGESRLTPFSGLIAEEE